METEKSGVWTLPNGEKITVILKVLPDGDGRFGGVYVAATPSLASGRPSAAPVAVTVEDEEGNAYTYTPVVPNMGLFAKLPDRFFAADYPVGNGPLPSRLVWRVTGASLYSDDWEEATGEPLELAYYPAGRVGASGECLTEYPWRWWWGEDCEAPLPISRELIPTEGNPIEIALDSQTEPYFPAPLVLDTASYPFVIMGSLSRANGFCMLASSADSDSDFLRYPALSAGTGRARGEYAYVFGFLADEEDVDGSLYAQFRVWNGDSDITGDFDICIGLLTGLNATDFIAERPPEADNVEYSQYDSVEQIGAVEVYPLGFSVTGSEWNIDKLIWIRLRIKGGVRRQWGYLVKLNYTPDHDKQRYWLAFGVLQLGNAAPPLNPYTGNYAPFVIGGGACRDDILNSPKHRGRLTHMRLPDCDIDYYVKWWDNSGACYVLPYSIIGGKTEGRQDGTPLYQDTQTLRLASPLLTVDERKDAMTIAESPRVAIRAYGGEWSYARLKDYSVSWEAGEEDEATLEIEVIANYGES